MIFKPESNFFGSNTNSVLLLGFMILTGCKRMMVLAMGSLLLLSKMDLWIYGILRNSWMGKGNIGHRILRENLI